MKEITLDEVYNCYVEHCSEVGCWGIKPMVFFEYCDEIKNSGYKII